MENAVPVNTVQFQGCLLDSKCTKAVISVIVSKSLLFETLQYYSFFCKYCWSLVLFTSLLFE
ncbi:unnamed protein product [Wuchereria bancrofti]|uniref:Uncharacterized protein n=1 Tax=Wuchereria bancrofti TaxID=6293 RepID=A0A3P7FQ62_WUCBA|nr:unnamed protein product [Wuchereria bancrofti]